MWPFANQEVTMFDEMAAKFDSEDAKWQAVVARDSAADGAFWLGVITTGIYCRPGCPARTPKRENVKFYRSRATARQDGLRPCKRCHPDEPPLAERQAKAVQAAVDIIKAAEVPPKLADLASAVGLSQHHFHRLFKAQLGVTPKQYADALKADRLKTSLVSGNRVTDAVYDAGYSAPSRMYEQATARLGMSPQQVKGKASGQELRYVITTCWLGRVIVAATEKGICAIQFGETDERLIEGVREVYPNAELTVAEAGSDYEAWVEDTLRFIEAPLTAPTMPLDVRGTAFQEQVWRALMTIPPGEKLSYSEVAEKIGKPKSIRAVANACGANRLAIVIPCHRVIGKSGSGGYRWGVERKEKILEREEGV